MSDKFLEILDWVIICNASIHVFIPLIWGLSLFLGSYIFISWWHIELHSTLSNLAIFPIDFIFEFYGNWIFIPFILLIIFFFKSATDWGGYDNLGNSDGM